MTRHERIRLRLPDGTPEEMAREKSEEHIQRGFKLAVNAIRMMQLDPEIKEEIISDNIVNFCAKQKIKVADLTAKISALEKVRTDKIKEEEDKIKPQGGQHEIR